MKEPDKFVSEPKGDAQKPVSWSGKQSGAVLNRPGLSYSKRTSGPGENYQSYVGRCYKCGSPDHRQASCTRGNMGPRPMGQQQDFHGQGASWNGTSQSWNQGNQQSNGPQPGASFKQRRNWYEQPHQGHQRYQGQSQGNQAQLMSQNTGVRVIVPQTDQLYQEFRNQPNESVSCDRNEQQSSVPSKPVVSDTVHKFSV